MQTAGTELLTRHFYHAFEGNIWKIRVDPFTQNLALEIRQKEVLQAGFWTVDTKTGGLLLKDYSTPERWWTGLEDAFGGNLFLHGYHQNRETGEHLGMLTISETDGGTKWHSPNLVFMGLNSDETLLAENALGQLREIELATGLENGFFQSREYAKTQLKTFGERRSQGMQFPVPYLPGDVHYALLQRFIEKKTGRKAEQTIEYLETGEKIILGFYALNGTVLSNYLVACSSAGDVLLDFCMETNVAGLGSDTFFIFAAKLFFIQGKTGLACYLL